MVLGRVRFRFVITCFSCPKHVLALAPLSELPVHLPPTKTRSTRPRQSPQLPSTPGPVNHRSSDIGNLLDSIGNGVSAAGRQHRSDRRCIALFDGPPIRYANQCFSRHGLYDEASATVWLRPRQCIERCRNFRPMLTQGKKMPAPTSLKGLTFVCTPAAGCCDHDDHGAGINVCCCQSTSPRRCPQSLPVLPRHWLVGTVLSLNKAPSSLTGRPPHAKCQPRR